MINKLLVYIIPLLLLLVFKSKSNKIISTDQEDSGLNEKLVNNNTPKETSSNLPKSKPKRVTDPTDQLKHSPDQLKHSPDQVKHSPDQLKHSPDQVKYSPDQSHFDSKLVKHSKPYKDEVKNIPLRKKPKKQLITINEYLKSNSSTIKNNRYFIKRSKNLPLKKSKN